MTGDAKAKLHAKKVKWISTKVLRKFEQRRKPTPPLPTPTKQIFLHIKIFSNENESIFPRIFLAVLLLSLFSSCKKEIRDKTSEENLASISEKSRASGSEQAESSKPGLLKSVRSATSRFHSTTQAIAAGYEPDDHCVSVPGLGGMGYHWVNPSLVDEVFDPLKPEVVLYASGPGGNLRLVAIEYIVINAGQAAPTFGNEPFNVGGTPVPEPHWSLHVWLYEDNPSGMFTPFNPNISCP